MMAERKKIAVLFSGTGTNFAYIVKHLHNKVLEVVVALTNNPEAKGCDVAKKAGIPLEVVRPDDFESREVFDAEVVRRLSPYEPALTVLAGFMRILTPVFTEQKGRLICIRHCCQDTRGYMRLSVAMKMNTPTEEYRYTG